MGWRIAGLAGIVLLVALAPVIRRSRHVASYDREDHERALRELREAKKPKDRYNALADSAKTSVFFGTLDEARDQALELLDLSRTMPKSWNFGNAVHDGHMVLGLVALRQGRVEEAERELLLAGDTPGSPQLDTFGPNMTLAKELLEHGRVEAVVAYFEKCRRFWESEDDRLDAWTNDARSGRTPDFGANLVY
jgi:hypothetical protein